MNLEPIERREFLAANASALLAAAPGKLVRAPFLFQRRLPIIIAPIDDYLIFGPRNGLEDRAVRLAAIIAAEPDAILTFAGGIKQNAQEFSRVRRIVNLSASTTRSRHTRKQMVHGIDGALRNHANAVAFHINLSSRGANRMIHEASEVVTHAEKYQIPTLGIVYPRGEKADGSDENYEAMRLSDPDAYADLVAHCVSLGVDLGFDAIKTQYTATTDTFRRVVLAANSVPILVAGGPMIPRSDALAIASNAIAAGAAGISFGRNIFGRKDPGSLIAAIRTLSGPWTGKQ